MNSLNICIAVIGVMSLGASTLAQTPQFIPDGYRDGSCRVPRSAQRRPPMSRKIMGALALAVTLVLPLAASAQTFAIQGGTVHTLTGDPFVGTVVIRDSGQPDLFGEDSEMPKFEGKLSDEQIVTLADCIVRQWLPVDSEEPVGAEAEAD